MEGSDDSPPADAQDGPPPSRLDWSLGDAIRARSVTHMFESQSLSQGSLGDARSGSPAPLAVTAMKRKRSDDDQGDDDRPTKRRNRDDLDYYHSMVLYPCPLVGCHRHHRGFDTPAELDAHIAESHAPAPAQSGNDTQNPRRASENREEGEEREPRVGDGAAPALAAASPPGEIDDTSPPHVESSALSLHEPDASGAPVEDRVFCDDPRCVYAASSRTFKGFGSKKGQGYHKLRYHHAVPLPPAPAQPLRKARATRDDGDADYMPHKERKKAAAATPPKPRRPRANTTPKARPIVPQPLALAAPDEGAVEQEPPPTRADLNRESRALSQDLGQQRHCPVQGCAYQTKRPDLLRRHMRQRHSAEAHIEGPPVALADAALSALTGWDQPHIYLNAHYVPMVLSLPVRTRPSVGRLLSNLISQAVHAHDWHSLFIMPSCVMRKPPKLAQDDSCTALIERRVQLFASGEDGRRQLWAEVVAEAVRRQPQPFTDTRIVRLTQPLLVITVRLYASWSRVAFTRPLPTPRRPCVPSSLTLFVGTPMRKGFARRLARNGLSLRRRCEGALRPRHKRGSWP